MILKNVIRFVGKYDIDIDLMSITFFFFFFFFLGIHFKLSYGDSLKSVILKKQTI